MWNVVECFLRSGYMEEDKKECMIMTCWRRLTVGQGVFILFVFTAIVIIKFWMVYGGWDEVRTIGDTKFDAMSALFSGLAFAGLICTILLQQFELKATREELRRSAQANQDAAKAAKTAVEIAELHIKAQYYNTVLSITHTRLLHYIDMESRKRERGIQSGEKYVDEVNKLINAINPDIEKFAEIAKVKYHNLPKIPDEDKRLFKK